MSPEKLLAMILTAWHESDGRTVTPELSRALNVAEANFDGVEEMVDGTDIQAR